MLLTAAGTTLRAEQTAGFCQLSEEEKGKEVLEIYAAVNFYTQPASGQKLHIWIDLLVPTRLLYDGIRLQRRTRLYDFDRKSAAKVLNEFNPLKILEERDSMTHVVIAGFIDKACAHPDFFPEYELSKLLEGATDNARLDYFQAFLEKFQFTPRKESLAYTSWLLPQPDFVRQRMEPRLLMVFYQHELIAIFHTGTVVVKRYDSIEMGKQYKMIYNSKFSDHSKKEMVELYRRQLE